MRLLLIGSVYNQHMMNYALSLEKIGFEIYGFNLSSSIHSPEGYERTPYKKVWSIKRHNDSRIKDFVSKTYGCLMMLYRIKEHFDVAQFHFINIYSLLFALICKGKKIKFSSFVYGSDFLRSNKWGKIYLKYVFKYSDKVVCDSTTVKEKMQSTYPTMKEKFHCVLFGSIIIDELVEKYESNIVKRSGDRINVMIGYNGASAQNHIKILNAIKAFRHRIYVILPMTYGGSVEYIYEVENTLKSQMFDYELLKSFVPNEEWEQYLVNTDIFIHMQDSDAFSSALAEHLLLGNIVINAEWLEYADLKNNDVYYLTSNFEELSCTFEQILDDMEKIKEKAESNKEKIIRLKSLNYCVENYWKPYFESFVCEGNE